MNCYRLSVSMCTQVELLFYAHVYTSSVIPLYFSLFYHWLYLNCSINWCSSRYPPPYIVSLDHHELSKISIQNGIFIRHKASSFHLQRTSFQLCFKIYGVRVNLLFRKLYSYLCVILVTYTAFTQWCVINREQITSYNEASVLWTNYNLTHLFLDKMAAIFTDDIFRRIFVNEKFCILLKFHRSLFLRVQLTLTQHWFR